LSPPRDRNRIRNQRRPNMTRFGWLAGLLCLALPASAVLGQSAALTSVALACPLGHEDAQAAPATTESDECCTSCPVHKLVQTFIDSWTLLWHCGDFAQAERVAARAVRLCPSSVDAQHALIVSQIVNAAGVAGSPTCSPITSCAATAPDCGDVGQILRAGVVHLENAGETYEAGCLPYGQFECEEVCENPPQTSASCPACVQAAGKCKACCPTTATCPACPICVGV